MKELDDLILKLKHWLDDNKNRLVDESSTFLTDTEKEQVCADPTSYLLSGTAYNNLFFSPSIITMTGAAAALGLYR